MKRLVLVAVVVALIAGGWLVVRSAGSLLSPATGPSWYVRTVYPLEHAGVIRSAARRNGIDPALVAAVIYAESRFDEYARSPQGAVGLMQVLPETGEQIATETGGAGFVPADLEDPAVNIRYGSYYLRRALDVFDGDVRAAVASYNAGIGVVGEWTAEAAADGHGFRVAEIPYAETRAYVRQVLELRRMYRQTYGDDLRRTSSPG